MLQSSRDEREEEELMKEIRHLNAVGIEEEQRRETLKGLLESVRHLVSSVNVLIERPRYYHCNNNNNNNGNAFTATLREIEWILRTVKNKIETSGLLEKDSQSETIGRVEEDSDILLDTISIFFRNQNILLQSNRGMNSTQMNDEINNQLNNIKAKLSHMSNELDIYISDYKVRHEKLLRKCDHFAHLLEKWMIPLKIIEQQQQQQQQIDWHKNLGSLPTIKYILKYIEDLPNYTKYLLHIQFNQNNKIN